MFWFAGLLGMAIESKLVRCWLAASSISSSGLSPRRSDQTVAEPPSYVASFNPFPALVIGVTGAAMAAHAQTYMFQVNQFSCISTQSNELNHSSFHRFKFTNFGETFFWAGPS
jgi:hypothetical protein